MEQIYIFFFKSLCVVSRSLIKIPGSVDTVGKYPDNSRYKYPEHATEDETPGSEAVVASLKKYLDMRI